jgi:ABC-type polysaccharide/polyol phosphate transport system ATPase subunit
MASIEFSGVSKSFLRQSGRRMLLRGHLKTLFQRTTKDRFYALKNVSFRINHGENVAIVGGNGAGKSTLLSLIAGLAVPDAGTVKVFGRLAALLQLGSGFHPDLTGRENIFLNASLLGLNRKKTEEIFEEVVAFSEIGDFIEEPLRTYSSGMTLRLAFSIAVNVDPDFILVDEVLAVGDKHFQSKCFEKIVQLKQSGKSFVCVSHSTALVSDFCERAIWLDHGELMADDKTEKVIKLYEGQSVLPPTLSS